jgi:tight adherence protein C
MALDLGMTRKSALLAFEERCPVDEVRDLVRAVIMAEQKGASVASALVQQARSSRQRRSVRAEEAAARAGVMLILPLMLLMGSILLILVGPLVCQGNVL